MSVITQYLIVIVIYFVAMLGIGILAGRKITNDGDDYFLAKDKLSAAAIGFSFSATQMSGSTYLGTVGTLSTIGYPFVPGALSSAAAPWFCYILLGDRVRQVAARLKSVTLGDIIESRYGKAASILSTCLMLVCLIPSVAGQLKAAGSAFQVLLNMPYMTAIIVFGAIVLIYTLLGGMFAVAWTDLVQGIIMVVGILIMVPVCLGKVGGLTAMNEAFAQINPQGASLTSGQPMMWVISGFLVWGFYQIGGQPAATTRFLTTSDGKTMKKALSYSIVFESVIFLGISILAFCALPLLVGVDIPSSDMTLPLLIREYLHPLLGGVILAAALGAMMSTVETVVLLSKGEVDSRKIRVEFSLEDMDMSEFQDGATYPQIKEYVLEHTGLKVSNLYISQIKRKCGIEVGKNYNLPKSEDSRQPQCPPEKEKAIREAFKYFGMI